MNGSDGRGPNAPSLCRACNGVEGAAREREAWREHREKVERLWAQGLPSWRIANEMGWNPRTMEGFGSPATYIARLRQKGYNLPHRRPWMVETGKRITRVRKAA